MCGIPKDMSAAADTTQQGDLEKLYKRYCECRDQEIERFWKNSTFVWVFLSLCLTAFGILLRDYLKGQSNNDFSKESYEITLAIISFIGIAISKIWTWMARGLKSWFEVYEVALWDVECKHNEFKLDRRFTINNYWGGKSNKRFERISPSKIVIFIGHILSIIWYISFVIWVCAYNNCSLITGNEIDVYCVLFSITPMAIFLSYFFIKSSDLRDNEEESIFNNIKTDLLNKKIQIIADEGQLPDLYFEVKKQKVTFFTKTEEQEIAIRNYYYRYTPKTEIDGSITKLSFKQEDISKFYETAQTKEKYDINDISKSFDDCRIKTDEIRILNKCIYIYLQNSVYQANANKIAEMVNKFAQKNKIVYIQYKLKN